MNAWPIDSTPAIEAFFGPRGDESNLTRLALPYEMRLAWDPAQRVRRVTCHKLVADSLGRVLASILEHYGSPEEVAAHRMDLFGGCYNVRRMRGGTSWSRHSWGIAIDLDPLQNGLMTPWPDKATMPLEVIKLFEAEGWKSGARAWKRDAMHFQCTR